MKISNDKVILTRKEEIAYDRICTMLEAVFENREIKVDENLMKGMSTLWNNLAYFWQNCVKEED